MVLDELGSRKERKRKIKKKKSKGLRVRKRMLNRKERWVNEYPGRFGELHRARGWTQMPVSSSTPP